MYRSNSAKRRPRETADYARLVIPTNLRTDVLLMCHSDVQGGHQGILRTYERAHREFHWIGMSADVELYVQTCVDCVTGKGIPRNPGPSPGNMVATYPFHIVSMDFVIPLLRSTRGNTALLLFQDRFSGFCMSPHELNHSPGRNRSLREGSLQKLRRQRSNPVRPRP